MLDAALLPVENDLVRLRPLRPADAAAYAHGAEDAAVRAYAHLPEPHYTPASAAAMIEGPAAAGLERGDLAVLSIAHVSSDELAGSLVLFDVTDEDAEVGFWLHPDHRGGGRAPAALELAARFACRSGMKALTARTVPGNAAALRVLAAAGFSETGQAEGTAPSGETVELVHLRRELIGSGRALRTARLELRPHAMGDAAWLHRIYSQPRVARFLLEEAWTRDDAEARLSERLRRSGLDGPSGALALVIEHAGEPVGDVALWLTDRERRLAEIGWVLDPAQGGQGYAAEAVRAVLGLGFAECGLHCIVAQMDARNTASARLAEAVGMVREAHLRQNWWSKGEWTDTLVYGMLASDRRGKAPE